MSDARIFKTAMHSSEFIKQLQLLNKKGHAKIFRDVRWMLDNATSFGISPAVYPTTHHGESRIKKCVKYDLDKFFRCVTIQDDDWIFFAFVGNHDEVDRWLTRNRGLVVALGKDGRLEKIRDSTTIAGGHEGGDDENDFYNGPLFQRLEGSVVDDLLTGVAPSKIAALQRIDASTSDKDIRIACAGCGDEQRAACVFDVLMSLRAGNLAEAYRRHALYRQYFQQLQAVDDSLEIRDGDTVRIVRVDSDEYRNLIKSLMTKDTFEEWLLFTHPEQDRVVAREFEGSAKLSGVSGSGKTSILVRRALRLAQKGNGRVLVLTLNKSLALLINRLVDYAAPDEEVRRRVRVSSFFELCQEILLEHEPQHAKSYLDVSWKNGEHIDEIWREYYRCQANNHDAQVMRPLHISLVCRGVGAESYLRQEMDWVRSACRDASRTEYPGMDRVGRVIPFDDKSRNAVLEGLRGWETKMREVGVIDHLGLAVVMSRYLKDIPARYDHILVDEMQDFGTLELEIVRALVKEGPNDLFLCGDLAQRVQVKHQALEVAGIRVPKADAVQIRRNYRNSREILKVARHVLFGTLATLEMPPGEVELLDPEFSNFSSPLPVALRAEDPRDEFAFAHQMASRAASRGSVCIAFAGYSLRDVQEFGKRMDLPVLDGTTALEKGRIFLSDLEQTKGFEFDEMYILNCSDDVLPQKDMPLGEQYRDLCRLYVAMTRTKTQLTVSYSGTLSRWLEGCSEDLLARMEWAEVEQLNDEALRELPRHLPDHERDVTWREMTGTAYVYLQEAGAAGPELLEKMCELVDGRVLLKNGVPHKWRTLGDAVSAVGKSPAAKQVWGLKLHLDLLRHFKAI